MRKGADVLSKWVGESERQLRLLFAEAQRQRAFHLFFDEIDGLAPVRWSKTDQIHNSIVATLLALMDGLDARGRVVVLGATNRVDAIDGALRRPGRFDRELAFALPDAKARAEISKIHTIALGAKAAPRCCWSTSLRSAWILRRRLEGAVHGGGRSRARRRYPPDLRERRQAGDRPRARLNRPRGLPRRHGGHHAGVAPRRAGAREADGALRRPSWAKRWRARWRRRHAFPPRRWRTRGRRKAAAAAARVRRRRPNPRVFAVRDDPDDADASDDARRGSWTSSGAGVSNAGGSRRRPSASAAACARGGARVGNSRSRGSPACCSRAAGAGQAAARGGAAPRARLVPSPSPRRGSPSPAARTEADRPRRRWWAR